MVLKLPDTPGQSPNRTHVDLSHLHFFKVGYSTGWTSPEPRPKRRWLMGGSSHCIIVLEKNAIPPLAIVSLPVRPRHNALPVGPGQDH